MFGLSNFHELILMYVFFHLFLMILSIFTFSKLGKDIVTIWESNFFRFLILMFVIYVITAVVWSLLENEVISVPRWVFLLNSTLSYIALALISFSLFMFMVVRHGMVISKHNWFWFVSLSPILLDVILLIVNLGTGIVFSVTPNENGYLHLNNGDLYGLMTFFGMSYFIAIFGMSVVNLFKTTSLIRRKEYFTLAIAMLIIGGVVGIGIIFKHLTVLPMAINAAITFIFANLQESGINNDALTGLNNRRRAKDYLTESLTSVTPQQPLFLFISDINLFKDINDKFGHMEGDNALMIVANVTKEVVSEYAGFAARFGGDEFIFSIRPNDNRIKEFTPEEIIEKIKSTLDKECKLLKKPYTLSMSVGYTNCDDPTLPLNVYIAKADKMLYKLKKEYHQSVGRT